MTISAQTVLASTSSSSEMSATNHAGLTRGSARSVLLTILGELVWQSGKPAKTSALLHVMSLLGIEEATARQAILRGGEAGWIISQKHGREVSWSLSPELITVFEQGSRRVEELSNPFREWDSRWLTLFITIPKSHRSQRKRLYRDLRWAGFGNPAAGVWLSPHTERRDQVAEIIHRLDLTDFVMSFVGQVDGVGLSEAEIVQQGWDLKSLEVDYAEVYEEFADPKPTTEDERLLIAIRALGQLQRFPFSDPQLPEALLPDWIGRKVSAHIQRLRQSWSQAVAQRWSEINNS